MGVLDRAPKPVPMRCINALHVFLCLIDTLLNLDSKGIPTISTVLAIFTIYAALAIFTIYAALTVDSVRSVFAVDAIFAVDSVRSVASIFAVDTALADRKST